MRMADSDPNDEIENISDLINEGKCEDALKKLKLLESQMPNNTEFLMNCVALRIDIGLGLKNSELISGAIHLGESYLDKTSCHQYKNHLYYNIANGYSSLFLLEHEKNRNIKLIIDNENLQMAKTCFRKAIEENDGLNFSFNAVLWTNYGNCLDHLGRGIEAIYAYNEALRHDSKHTMAMGNRAVAMWHFSKISGAYRTPISISAYQTLKSLLNNNDLIQFGGIKAKHSFQGIVQQIENEFNDKRILEQNIEHPAYDLKHLSEFEKTYFEFCSRYKLFLNFHIHDDLCEPALSDSIFIRLITSVNDTTTFYTLAKYINQIKEDYAVARLLLVQSQFINQAFNNINQQTTYANTLDYSQFNIYTGLLKSAFKEAYNILDKIAHFINEYYNLGMKSDIYFTSIWQDGPKNAKKIRERILKSENPSLYALYDIYLDFKSGQYKQIQDIRNASVHERLVIYDSALTDWDEKNDKNNIGYNTMLSQTINLFQLVKSAIIYMINFVELEENKKRKDERPLPMLVETY